MAFGDPINNPASFRNEARWQRVCAVCKKAGPWQAHHVLIEQELERRGVKPWDTRNALRICTEGQDNCHSRHHWKVRAIRTVELLDCNVLYAFEILGPYAADWLRRYYDDITPDPRIIQLSSGVTA